MICPRCNKGKIDYKQYRYTKQVMCPECHYYIHIKEFENEQNRIHEQNCSNE